jgi:hypothetical protein
MTWTISLINEVIKLLSKEIVMTKNVYSKKVEKGEVGQHTLDERLSLLQALLDEKNRQLMELQENPLGIVKQASELVEFRVSYAPKVAEAAQKQNPNHLANLRFGYVAGTLSYITGLDSVCEYSTKEVVQLKLYPKIKDIDFENGIFVYERLTSSTMMHKIANWKATFKRILNVDYGKISPAELKLMQGTYKDVSFDLELIEFYLNCKTYPFKAGEPKTIKIYLSQNTTLVQMYAQKDVELKPKIQFPDNWDNVWYNKQEEEVRRQYIAHLKGLGFDKKTSDGGITYYTKQQ